MENFWHKIKKPILALAPMAGITDSAFRQISMEYGADVCYSEMASATALFFKPQKTLQLLKFSKEERPYVVQLFGKHPEHYARAARIITEKIKPDGIDINFGCPAKKVFTHGSGCALMLEPDLAKQIIEEVVQNTNLPVSIKIRAGVKSATALDFINDTRHLGYSSVMVHGRTYEGNFTGSVDFKIVSEIKKMIPDRIVMGNGGIINPFDAIEILAKYPSIDGLGIARGAWGKPYIFKDIKDLLKNKKIKKRSYEEILYIILKHAKLAEENNGDRGILEMRKNMSWYIKGFPGASDIRNRLVSARNIREIENILQQTRLKVSS